jgi:hypothetical protein
MKSAQPQWRTDHLPCPLNAGKLSSVAQLIVAMRQCATLEAALQWQQFHRKHWTGFESMASKGWNREWVKSGKLTTSYGQMVMAQVAGSLQGYLGNVMNTYTAMVSGSTLSPTIRHQLHSINRQSAWFHVGAVTVEQVTVSTNAAGKTTQHKAKVIISDEVRDLARTLIRRAISQHRKPHFRAFQPQIDQRAVFLQQPQKAKSQDLWLVLSGREAGQRLALPVKTHPQFIKRQKQAKYDQALDCAGDQGDRMAAGIHNAIFQARGIDPDPKKQAKEKHKVRRLLADEANHNPRPCRFTLAKTIRLLLSEDQKSLSIAVATDMRSTHEQSAACYRPKMGALGLDMGLCTLFGSDQGDLLGRNWLIKLERYDRLLQSIARHRQQLGLKTASPRYRRIVESLRGMIKSEINRIFNRLVKGKAPSQFIMETPEFYRNPKLSRRLNRIMSNFGAGIITAKLKDLETQFGITTQFVPAAYSSQLCSSCGYVDKRNRQEQEKFHCKFCNTKLHADVNAPRNLVARRSCRPDQKTDQMCEKRFSKQQILTEMIRRFNERYTRPRGGPADPRLTNPYFKEWNTQVRSTEAEMLPSSQRVLECPTRNANRAKYSPSIER